MDAPAEKGPVDVVLCVDREAYSRLWEVIRHLCVGLIDLNARVRLLCSSPEIEALTLGPIQTIVHAEPTWPFSRGRMRQIVDQLGDRRPTVVHALSQGSFRLTHALAKSFGVDAVVHLTAAADIRGLQRFPEGALQRVIAASGPLFDLACESHFVPEEAISVIRPGVLRADAPTCFTRPGRVPALLCTASLEQDTGVEQLIHAIRILCDRGFDLLAFFAGGGSCEGQLRRLVRQQGVSQRVTFARPSAEIGSLLSGADIWVSPAPERVLSFSSLAAMGTGTAVVTCAGGVTDHCVDGRTAIVCPQEEPAALADGIERLLRDPDLAGRLATAGLAHLKEHHTVSAMADQVMGVYRALAVRRATFPLKN